MKEKYGVVNSEQEKLAQEEVRKRARKAKESNDGKKGQVGDDKRDGREG
jgi:hypothetical protein